ncbi:SDR family NAD(P)-dependent oxidoreductase [Candidatus Calescamantes bacterium]|nr:SDR family NAD(P)-dependent oxidoreductase [Candidatus Calescamantes bacterium]
MSLKDARVMVTGGAGFIGSHLVRELIERKAHVIVFDNLFSGDQENLKDIESKIILVKGDIRDREFVKTLKEFEIEYIFNLAAEPYIPYCYDRPWGFVEINTMGALNVFLACKEAGVKRIIQYSTSEVYGKAEYLPMDEEHPTFPLSTYAVSKLAADRLAFTLHHEIGLPVIILRQFNCFGPRVTQPYVIPEIISQLSRGNHLKLGNVKARRDLTYVEDAARGAVMLMECDEAVGEVVNMGSKENYSVEELAYVIGELMGYKKVNIEVDKNRLRPLDVEVLLCNPEKMHRLTGWEPRVSLREGLKNMIEYYLTHGKKWLWEKKLIPEERMWKK